MPLNYSKWDNIVDSDDDDGPTTGGVDRPDTSNPTEVGEQRSATVKPGFVVHCPAANDGHPPLFINVCSSGVVEETMSSTPHGSASLGVSFPYQLGNLRPELDGDTQVAVVELMVSPGTLTQSMATKQAQQALITAAVQLASKHVLPLREEEWKLCTRDELREPDGQSYFFAPGRLCPGEE